MKQLLAILLLFICATSVAQNVSVQLHNITLKEALYELEKKTKGITFSYNNNLKGLQQEINKEFINKSIRQILDDLLYPIKLSYKKIGNTIIIYEIFKDNIQKPQTVSGYVYDKATGEILIGATIFSVETGRGTSTNNYGFYSLSLPKNNTTIYVSYMGYKGEMITVDYRRRNVYLVLKNDELEEIEIEGTTKTLQKNFAGAVNITPEEIKEIPLLLGEPDVLKAIQQQNGIRTVTDGSSFYYVRGGNFDQNLVLLDEAPLYNPAHMLGLVSVINGDVIKNTNFYKGFFPAKYSGRLASVLDITTKDGNKKNFQLSGGISTLGIRIAAEGPLVKDKVSYMISGRKSLLDFLAKNTSTLSPNYYDINAKVHWKMNDRNNWFFSLYNGRDVYSHKDSRLDVKTMNYSGTLRWNHIYNEKLFANTSFIYNGFKGSFSISDDTNNWKNGVEEVRLKHQLTYFLNDNNTFETGLKIGFHNYEPGKYENRNINFGTKRLQSFNLFGNHKFRISEQFTIDYGCNLNLTNALGNSKLLTLDSDYNISNTFQSGSGIYKSWLGIEPRVNLLYKLNTNNRFLISYSKMRQFVHSPYPYQNDLNIINLWIPVSNNIEPLSSNIYSVGYNFAYRKIGVNIEGYYKNIKNQLDYTAYPDIKDANYERYLRSGNANSYGMEISVGYKTERMELNADYSYSKTTVRNKHVNNGERYITRYDIPHQLNITGIFNFTRRLDFAVSWMYKTGRPYTLPVASQVLNGGNSLVPLYGKRHNARFNDYHKLDFMFTIKPKRSQHRWKGTWKAGITNAYAQLNPMYITNNYNYHSYGKSIKFQGGNLFRFFPILSYSFQF